MKGFNFGSPLGFNFNSPNPIVQASHETETSKANPFAKFVNSSPAKPKRNLFSQPSPPYNPFQTQNSNVFSQPFNTNVQIPSDSEMNIDTQPNSQNTQMSFGTQSQGSNMSISQPPEDIFPKFTGTNVFSTTHVSPPKRREPPIIPPTPTPNFTHNSPIRRPTSSRSVPSSTFTHSSPTLQRKKKRKRKEGAPRRKRKKIQRESPRKSARRRGTKRPSKSSRTDRRKRQKRRSSVDDLVEGLQRSSFRDESSTKASTSYQAADMKTEDSNESPGVSKAERPFMTKRPSASYSFNRESLGGSTSYSFSSKDLNKPMKKQPNHSTAKKDASKSTRYSYSRSTSKAERNRRKAKKKQPPRKKSPLARKKSPPPAPTPRTSFESEIDIDTNVKKRLAKLKKQESKQKRESREKAHIIRNLKKDLSLIRSTFKYDPLGLLRYLCPKLTVPKSRPSKKDVQRLYRKALHYCHPDRTRSSSLQKKVEAEEKFKILAEFKDKILASGR